MNKKKSDFSRNLEDFWECHYILIYSISDKYFSLKRNYIIKLKIIYRTIWNYLLKILIWSQFNKYIFNLLLFKKKISDILMGSAKLLTITHF